MAGTFDAAALLEPKKHGLWDVCLKKNVRNSFEIRRSKFTMLFLLLLMQSDFPKKKHFQNSKRMKERKNKLNFPIIVIEIFLTVRLVLSFFCYICNAHHCTYYTCHLFEFYQLTAVYSVNSMNRPEFNFRTIAVPAVFAFVWYQSSHASQTNNQPNV